ncbi:MAG: methyltransferase domain-containing protein [Alphaproteobacteria bacterium]|nr:methyltransferase domain-containing protein [Alphaproteobacteria bacterium]
MDRMYRHQRHVYDLTRKYYLLGRDRLIDRLAVPTGGTVLEIGCGTGRNLVAAARRYHDAHLVGLDVSAAMLATAQRRIDGAGLSPRVRLVCADATALSDDALPDAPRFDRVFISYSLSMIPGWRDVLAGAADLLAPSGELHVLDFGDQARLPAWLRRGLRRWLALFDVSPRDDLAAALCAVGETRALSVTAQSLYGGYARYAVARRRC